MASARSRSQSVSPISTVFELSDDEAISSVDLSSRHLDSDMTPLLSSAMTPGSGFVGSSSTVLRGHGSRRQARYPDSVNQLTAGRRWKREEGQVEWDNNQISEVQEREEVTEGEYQNEARGVDQDEENEDARGDEDDTSENAQVQQEPPPWGIIDDEIDELLKVVDDMRTDLNEMQVQSQFSAELVRLWMEEVDKTKEEYGMLQRESTARQNSIDDDVCLIGSGGYRGGGDDDGDDDDNESVIQDEVSLFDESPVEGEGRTLDAKSESKNQYHINGVRAEPCPEVSLTGQEEECTEEIKISILDLSDGGVPAQKEKYYAKRKGSFWPGSSIADPLNQHEDALDDDLEDYEDGNRGGCECGNGKREEDRQMWYRRPKQGQD